MANTVLACADGVGDQDSNIELFDPKAALVCVDGERELLREVVAIFREECPKLLAEVYDAVVGEDAPGLARSAHMLKGTVCNFGGRTATDMLFKLETMGGTGDFSGAAEALACLKI